MRRTISRVVPFLSLCALGGACAMQVDPAADSDAAAQPEEVEGSDLSSPLGHVEQAIEGGWIDTGDPAVGLVLSDGAFCTGTLIGESIVLTAAHCLDLGAVHSFYTGTGSASPTAWPTGLVRHTVDAQVVHPSYNAGGNPEDGTSGFDIGLIHLATPLCGAKTWPIKRTSPVEGSTCVAVGFGAHTESGLLSYSLKRACTESLTGVFAQVLGLAELTGHTADGDSGGPIVCDWGGIAGVVSGHRTFNVGQSYAARVDPVADWIDATSAGLRRPLERLACIEMVPCRLCKEGLFR